MPTLVVKYKDGSRAYPLREGVPVFIGRAKECDVHLPSPAVSRRHAVVIYKNGICGVKDLASFNGTLINGKMLTAAQHLTSVDVVQISSFIIRLDASDLPAGAQPAFTEEGSGDEQVLPGSEKGTTVILRHGKDKDAAQGGGGAGNPEETTVHEAPEGVSAGAGGNEERRKAESGATKQLRRSGSRTFPNSHILLPRAMEPAGDVDAMLENLPASGAGRGEGRDTLAYAPGADTAAFVRTSGGRAGVSAGASSASSADDDDRPFFPPLEDGSPESTVEMDFPTEYARSLAQEAQSDVDSIMPEREDGDAGADSPHDTSGRLRESCGWFDTDYFRDGAGGGADVDFDADEPRERPAAPEEAFPPAGEEASGAERIIPLNEPERAPRLTLEWDDDETNKALEALVADVSPAVSAFRAAALRSGVGGKDAFAEAIGEDPVELPEPFKTFEHVEHLETGAGGGAADGADAGNVSAADSVSDAAPDGDDPDATGSELTGAAAAAFDTVSVPVPASLLPVDSAGVPEDAQPFVGKAAVSGVEAVVITPALMAAMNARLALYPLLLDLAENRKTFRAENEPLSAEVAAELDRQDAELDSLPSAEEADRMINALASRRAQLAAVADHARANGLPIPEAGNPLLRRAEDMAEAQWRLVRDSNRETLPAVYKEAYKLCADEPLARDFAAARINHGRLFGGAMYLLALESVAETAQAERRDIADQIQRLAEKGLEKDSGGLLGRLGKIGDTVNKVKNRTEIREKSRYLEERDHDHAVVAARAAREFAFMEKALAREFRQVFMQVAAHFGYRDDMPPAVRAFLRYGVIGFKPWWMRPDVREFIMKDCRDNVVPAVQAAPGATIVLYADEYLGAVANMECPPFPDESLAGRDRNSVEWKTDRAFRRIVNASSYNILMDDMLNSLDMKLQEYEDKSAEIELRIAELTNWSASDNKDELFGLQTEQQVIAIRYENMQKHIKRIEKEVVASILESVEEAEGRFRRGELRMPDSEALAAKEAESLAVLAKRIGGSRQRFMPLVIREAASPAAVNDRKAVAARLAAIEKNDPGVFVSTIIPAKKKENRVELRLSPVVVIFPCAGSRGLFTTPRDGMEGGHLIVPACFPKKEMAEAAFASLLADFRWETSRLLGGRDVPRSDTLAGAFIRFRQEYAGEPKAKREKGYIFSELTDKRNWRRVYAAYLADAMNSTRRLPARNPGLYENVIAPYVG